VGQSSLPRGGWRACTPAAAALHAYGCGICSGMEDLVAAMDEQIAKLLADARRSHADTARLEADTSAYEEHIAELDARALLRDERIAALLREVDGLHAAAVSRGTIEQAKGTMTEPPSARSRQISARSTSTREASA
jgi:hypothetical protein